eukprot:TRINITY_DN24646_c0_g1_i1.p1 TRINITY_DN24646_c0_g1~~TRINITY_DN24646_c0_g1_i1.p1  ORF type:complete len:260 (-),score=14.00 TRINITY_DN24646_c0_g1_i1:219-998(-)
MKHAIQRQKLDAEEMDMGISKSVPFVDVETSTTYHTHSECSTNETSSIVCDGEDSLTFITQRTLDKMLLVEDVVPLERDHAFTYLKECGRRTDSRTACLSSEMPRLERCKVEDCTTRRSSPTHLTVVSTIEFPSGRHGSTSGENIANLRNVEALRVSCSIQRSCVPSALSCHMHVPERSAADGRRTILDDVRKLNPAWIGDDEESSDDEVRSTDSGIDGPPPCRRSAYDLGYAHHVQLPASWRRRPISGLAALRQFMSI